MVETGSPASLLEKLETFEFVEWLVPLSAFPRVERWTDYRDEAYARRMFGASLPPIVLCKQHWIDGRHRVWAWRQQGFACAKAIDLVELGLSPDFFIPYVLGASELHQTAAAVLESKALTRISSEEAVDFDLTDIQPKERRQVLQAVNRKIRDARFRANVLRAYSHRCCMCGVQLDLLDAAHIIPVEHERGTDEIKNGLSLCALHHRAFDHALVTVQTDYTIACSQKELLRLRSIGWHAGEPEFRAALRDEILLPPKKEIYPAPEYLAFGQELRGWSN